MKWKLMLAMVWFSLKWRTRKETQTAIEHETPRQGQSHILNKVHVIVFLAPAWALLLWKRLQQEDGGEEEEVRMSHLSQQKHQRHLLYINRSTDDWRGNQALRNNLCQQTNTELMTSLSSVHLFSNCFSLTQTLNPEQIASSSQG